METRKKRYDCEETNSFENLTPLLKNEYNRHKKQDKYNDLVKHKNKDKAHNTKDVKEISVTNSFNEDSPDLVINVELRTHKSNYFDAYFTDLDLHGRKAYHESVSKRKQSSDKSKFSDLNLMFSEDLSSYSTNSRREFYYNSEEKALSKPPFPTLLNESNKNYHHNSQKRNELHKSWSPLCYDDIPLKSFRKNNFTGFMQSKSDQTYRIRRNKMSRISIEYRNNEMKDLKALAKCSNFTSTDVSLLNYQDTNNRPYKSKKYFNNMDMVSSYPDVKSKRFQRRKIYSAVNFPDSPCMIKMQTSKFKMQKSFPVSKENSFVRPDMSYESQYFKENIYKFDRDHRHEVVIEQNSFMTTTISSTDTINGKYNRFTDTSYIKKKYNRQFQTDNIVKNSEFSEIINANKNLLNLDFEIGRLNKPDMSVTKKVEPIDITCLETNIEESVIEFEETQLISTKPSENMNLETNTDVKTNSTIKTLEVIFPVKSMREKHEKKLISRNMPDESSVIEVKITEERVLKSTEVSTQKQLNETLCDGSFNIENVKSRKLFENNVVSRKDDNSSDTNSEKISTDLKIILQNDKFKEMVLNIVDQYLKDNYLTDNNFKVIVVPKNKDLKSHLNHQEVLNDFLAEYISHSELNLRGSDFKISFPNLSTFNPRDFKGYVKIDERKNRCQPMIHSKRSVRRRPLLHDRPKPNAVMTPKPRICKVYGLEDLEVTEVIRKKLNKYTSLPIIRIKSSNKPLVENPLSKLNNILIGQHKKPNTKLVKVIRINDNNKTQKQIQNTISKNTECNSSKKSHKRMNKHCKHEGICGFITEFNEFKEIFNKVDIKQNALLHVLNYDPCGFTFKLKKCQHVPIHRKR